MKNIVVSNWEEFLNIPGKKLLCITSIECDSNVEIFHEFFRTHTTSLFPARVVRDEDAVTGLPSRLFNIIGIDNIKDILNEAPAVLLYEDDHYIRTYANLEQDDDETTIPANLERVIEEIEGNK